MRHRLFNMVAVLSMVLWAASIAGWVRSRWVGDDFGYNWHWQSNRVTTEITFGFAHGGGDFGFFYVEQTPPMDARGWVCLRGPATPLHEEVVKSPNTMLGYGYYSDELLSAGFTGSRNAIILPYWLLTLLTAIFPAWWILMSRHRRAARRIQQGLCPHCGYDLRASPEKSGPLFDRCPECGAIAAEPGERTGLVKN